MFKQRVVRLITAVVVAVALTGGIGVASQSLGFDVSPIVHACGNPNMGGGGGC